MLVFFIAVIDNQAVLLSNQFVEGVIIMVLLERLHESEHALVTEKQIKQTIKLSRLAFYVIIPTTIGAGYFCNPHIFRR